MSDTQPTSSSSTDLAAVQQQLQQQQLQWQETCIQALKDQFQTMMRDHARSATRDRSPATTAGVDDDFSEDEWHPDVTNAWADVLPATEKTATGASAVLVSRLQFPPPISQIKELRPVIQAWKGVPRAPPPHRGKFDRQLQHAQQKLEMAMDVAVLMASDRRYMDLDALTALERSTWQDLLECRRQSIAGRNAHRLEPRIDADNTKLFSAAEERLLQAPPPQQSQRRSGKGRGKGR